MTWILQLISYGEFVRLVICLSLDLVEYLVPLLLTPFVGDLFDIVALGTSLYLFRWVGLFALLELVPRADVLPINVMTWILWILLKRRKEVFDRMSGE